MIFSEVRFLFLFTLQALEQRLVEEENKRKEIEEAVRLAEQAKLDAEEEVKKAELEAEQRLQEENDALDLKRETVANAMKERMAAEQEALILAELLEQEKIKRHQRRKEAEDMKAAMEAKLRDEEFKQKQKLIKEEEEAKRIEKVCFMVCMNRNNVLIVF